MSQAKMIGRKKKEPSIKELIEFFKEIRNEQIHINSKDLYTLNISKFNL